LGSQVLIGILSDAASEDQFHAILTTWFPTSEGYMIDTGGEPDVRRGKRRNPLLIVELKRPERWNDAGKEQLV